MGTDHSWLHDVRGQAGAEAGEEEAEGAGAGYGDGVFEAGSVHGVKPKRRSRRLDISEMIMDVM